MYTVDYDDLLRFAWGCSQDCSDVVCVIITKIVPQTFNYSITRILFYTQGLLSFQLKCSSNIDSIHYLGLTNSFDQVPRNIHTLPSKIVNFLLNSLNAPITFVVCATNQSKIERK